MARMIPAEIPEQTQSQAERELFQVLRNKLGDDFTVFHSFNLLTRNLQSKFVDGEIDYLVFSPKYGFLVIEVKGGAIQFDGQTNSWFQNDHPLSKSPFEQASASKYKLRHFLADRLGQIPATSFAHAVCFPNVFTEIEDMPPGADPQICITGTKLHQIDKVIDEIFSNFRQDRHRPLDERELARVNRVLMPYCEYGMSLMDRIGAAERKIFALTENQCQLLEFITNRKYALIEGCAGSGKTVMAVKKARELGGQGKSVLMLSYNRMISEVLSEEVADLDTVLACSYHKYCRDLLSEAGCLHEEDTKSDDYWTNVLPQAFAEYIDKHPIKYDAIVVDEGQDFRVEWWVTITDLVKPEGHFYIFYDPAQNLWKTETEYPVSGPPFILSSNCRNTRTVFETLKPYATTEIYLKEDAPEGEAVRQYFLSSSRDRRKQLSRILHELVAQHYIPHQNIVILGGHSISHTCIGSNNQVGNFRIIEGPVSEPGFIGYYTYMKFKGCEADAVILLDVDPDDIRWDSTALYTAISRARYALHIIWSHR